MTNDIILLTDHTWISLDYLLVRRGGKPIAVWVFATAAAARRVARQFIGACLDVVRVRP